MSAVEEISQGSDLLSLETHIQGAAAFARALWRILDNDSLFKDNRDALAVRAIVSEILEHAEQGEGLFDRMNKGA